MFWSVSWLRQPGNSWLRQPVQNVTINQLVFAVLIPMLSDGWYLKVGHKGFIQHPAVLNIHNEHIIIHFKVQTKQMTKYH